MICRVVSVVLVITVCLTIASARSHGRKGKSKGHTNDHRPRDLYSQACIVTVNDITVRERGCPPDQLCDLGPLDFANENGDDVSLTFCDVEPDWAGAQRFGGVLRSACVIETGDLGVLQNNSCRGRDSQTSDCDVGPLHFLIPLNNDFIEAKAYFCSSDLATSHSQDDDDESSSRSGSDSSASSVSSASSASSDSSDSSDSSASRPVRRGKGGNNQP